MTRRADLRSSQPQNRASSPTGDRGPRTTCVAADGRARPLPTGSRRLSPAQALAVTRERLRWNRRAENWDNEGSRGLTKVVDAVVDGSRPCGGAVAADLGCGSGQVTIPLARECARVLA